MFTSIIPSRFEGVTTIPSEAPTVQTTNLVFVGDRALSFTRGNGSRVIVLARIGGVNATPSDNTSYTASDIYGDGDEIGTGNYVVYNGIGSSCLINDLPYGTTFGFRAFEYNGSSGSESYNTSTATGNPVSATTPSNPNWVLHANPIVNSIRRPDAPTTSYFSSKAYTLSAIELTSYRVLFVVGDNNLPALIDFHFDQVYIVYQDITDDPRDKSTWITIADGNGEPLPLLASAFNTGTDADRGQQWLGGLTRFSDSNVVGYYSANTSLTSRYSVFKATIDFTGFPATFPTLTRNGIVISQGAAFSSGAGGPQAYYDSDNTKWYLIVGNRNGTISDGRIAATEVYQSTDGITGMTFSRIQSDALSELPIDNLGLAMFSSIWANAGRLYQYIDKVHVGQYQTRKDSDQLGYAWINKDIALISWNLSDMTQRPIIENVQYVFNQGPGVAMWPCSRPISFGGETHVIVNVLTWQAIEDGRQHPIDIRVLSSSAFSGFNVVDGVAYPPYIHRYFKVHQTHLSDDINVGVPIPFELITEESGTVHGSPIQGALNKITSQTSSDYISDSDWNFTHDQEYLGISVVCDFSTADGGSIARPIVQKEGTFMIKTPDQQHVQVHLFGSNGNEKIYRSTLNKSTLKSAQFFPDYTRIGFTTSPNGVDDIILKLHVDNNMDIDVTILKDEKFTLIGQTSNPIEIGKNADLSVKPVDTLGSVLVMSGEDNATEYNWLNNNFN